MFPPIQPQNMKVSSIKRVLILNRSEDGEIDLRHYSINTKPVDLSKSIKKLINAKENSHKKLPNLGKVADVADFVLDPYANGAGFTSESEVDDDEVVQISENNPHFKQEKQQQEPELKTKKKAVKLTEIGPRLKLELIKIEDDVCSGKVLYHGLVKKTNAEVNKLEQRHAVRRKLKAQRRKEQDANVQAKKEKKEAKKLRRQQKKEEREKRLADGEDVSDEREESEEEEESDEELFSD